MAARRGKSQARRNSGNSGGLPGWAWLILGIVIALVAVLALPRVFKSGGSDGFILPRPNPDAQPSSSSSAGDEADLPSPVASAPKASGKDAAGDEEREYDFYTVLPGQEVAMSDAELAASARAEAARKQQLAQQQAAAAADAMSEDAATPAAAIPASPTPATPAPATTAAAATSDNEAPYILQAGAFGASGDAEAVKARIALLGLNARVESAALDGKTVYRVRMGPYGTATELAAAKAKLANGGLPAMAIKVK